MVPSPRSQRVEASKYGLGVQPGQQQIDPSEKLTSAGAPGLWMHKIWSRAGVFMQVPKSALGARPHPCLRHGMVRFGHVDFGNITDQSDLLSPASAKKATHPGTSH